MTAPKPRKKADRPGKTGAAARPNKRNAGQSRDSADQRIKLFVEALLSNGENITEAALAAGFAPKSAASQGSRLLKSVKVQQELDSRRAQVLAKFQLTTERTIQEIARLAYSDPRNFYNQDGTLKQIHDLSDDCAATVASIELEEIKAEGTVIGMTRKIKQWDKRAALDMAARIQGLYEKDNRQLQNITRIVMVPPKAARA